MGTKSSGSASSATIKHVIKRDTRAATKKELENLKTKGLVTEKEYEEKRKEILKEL